MARLEELRYFKKMGVHEECDIEECWRNKNPIKTRWVDTNKTDNEHDPNYRSRLVAKEYRTSDKPELYSGTPPLELMRMLIPKVADGQHCKQRWCSNISIDTEIKTLRCFIQTFQERISTHRRHSTSTSRFL